MKDIFTLGNKKMHSHVVIGGDLATFESGTVHPVYSTFAIARDAEWCCRLFVLEMKEEDEEGIGTFVHVKHLAPALLGAEITFEAEITELHRNTINCNWEAREGQRIIAKGSQGQKIIKRDRLEKLFYEIKKLR